MVLSPEVYAYTIDGKRQEPGMVPPKILAFDNSQKEAVSGPPENFAYGSSLDGVGAGTALAGVFFPSSFAIFLFFVGCSTS